MVEYQYKRYNGDTEIIISKHVLKSPRDYQLIMYWQSFGNDFTCFTEQRFTSKLLNKDLFILGSIILN